jgi:single-strand DNA-binding protein
MNLCIFSGRLTYDCEVRYTNSGTQVISFPLAVDCGYGEHKRTEYIRCTIWNRPQLAQYLTKGKAVMVQGEFVEYKYTDPNKIERSRVEIKVFSLEFQMSQPKSQNDKTQLDGQVPF